MRYLYSESTEETHLFWQFYSFKIQRIESFEELWKKGNEYVHNLSVSADVQQWATVFAPPSEIVMKPLLNLKNTKVTVTVRTW